MKKNGKTLLKLFTATLYLSAFTFGGGLVIVALMKKKFVKDLQWLEEREMLDLAAIAQSSPGAMAVNASILVGYHMAGLTGALVSIFATVLPPLLLISVISFFYASLRDNAIAEAILRAMRAGVAAVIIDVVIDMGTGIVREKKVVSILLMIAAFAAAFIFKINVFLIILVCMAAGVFIVLFAKWRNGRSV